MAIIFEMSTMNVLGAKGKTGYYIHLEKCFLQFAIAVKEICNSTKNLVKQNKKLWLRLFQAHILERDVSLKQMQKNKFVCFNYA